MDRHTTTELDVIKRIVALLLALALLAERAAARPLAVRIYVHSLLLNAQFAALKLFVEPAEIEADAAREASPGIERPTEPCDLIRIAVGLRALAMLLAAGCAALSRGGLPRRSAMPRRGREVHGTWRDTSASQALPGPEPPLPLLPSGEKVAA